MKVVPIPQTRRFNTYSYQQNPLRMPAKQQYDSVSFGNTRPFIVDGDLTHLEDLHKRIIDIKGNAVLGDAFADETLTIGGTLNANYISADEARLKGCATIKDKIDVRDLVAIGEFKTKHLGSNEAEKAQFIHGATITNSARVKTLTVASGDLTIGGNSFIERIFSAGGNVELANRIKLDSIILANPNPNTVPKPEDFVTRVLNFNSVNTAPKKIIVVLDKFQRLVVQAPEAVLSKLELHKFDDKIEGYIGDVLPPKAMEKLVTLVKTIL